MTAPVARPRTTNLPGAVVGGPTAQPGHPSRWLRLLVSFLGLCELLMAIGARPAVTMTVGVIGGVALVAAPWVNSRARPGGLPVLLVIGTVPFAALTWWSVVTPLLAVVALAIGLTIDRRARLAHRR